MRLIAGSRAPDLCGVCDRPGNRELTPSLAFPDPSNRLVRQQSQDATANHVVVVCNQNAYLRCDQSCILLLGSFLGSLGWLEYSLWFGRRGRCERECDYDHGTGTLRLSIHFALEMADAFTHSGNAYASASCLDRRELFRGDSFPLILNFKQNTEGAARKTPSEAQANSNHKRSSRHLDG